MTTLSKLPKPAVICFCGPKGSGKDTAARRLLARNSPPVKDSAYRVFNFAHPLKSGMEGLFYMSPKHLEDPLLKEIPMENPPHVVPREAIIWLAKAVRARFGEDYFAKLWGWRIRAFSKPCPDDIFLCTDLRHPPELEEIRSLREEGFKVTIVYVTNAKVEAKAKAGRESCDPLWCDDSEAHHQTLLEAADVVLTNDDSLNDLYSQVDKHLPNTFITQKA